MKTISFSDEEMLALKHILGFFTRISSGDQPYIDAMAEKLLDKTGRLKDSLILSDLEDSRLAKKWFKNHNACDACGKWFESNELTVDVDKEVICKSCLREKLEDENLVH